MGLTTVGAAAANILVIALFMTANFTVPIGQHKLFRLGRSLRSEPAQPELDVSLPRQLLVPPAETSFRMGQASEESFYLPWIRQDFDRWTAKGISWVRPGCTPSSRPSAAGFAAIGAQPVCPAEISFCWPDLDLHRLGTALSARQLHLCKIRLA